MIDIGGGDSRLVDHLAARGLDCLAVVDLSGAALARARARLSAAPVTWIEADVTADGWSAPTADLWHDRAAFHFLTDQADRARYVARLEKTLKRDGQAIIATFAPEGPPRCSGLPVVRYAPEELAAQLGPSFSVIETVREAHVTPFGGTQDFLYHRLRRRG